MTKRSLKQCAAPGCYVLVRETNRCPDHQRDSRRQNDSKRPTACKRGYGRRWQRVSKAWLSKPENALCCYCKAKGRIRASECVDHYIPHKGDMKLFWDRKNWRAACIQCNNAKGDKMPEREWAVAHDRQ